MQVASSPRNHLMNYTSYDDVDATGAQLEAAGARPLNSARA